MNRLVGNAVFLLLVLFLIGSVGVARTGRAGAEVPKGDSNDTPAEKFRYEFLVLGMSCDGCAESAEKALRDNIKDIRKVEVIFDSKKGVIRSSSAIEQSEIRRALGTLGFEPQFVGDSARPQPLSEEEKTRLDIETISTGEEVAIKSHLARGKLTVFDYYADWCGPCHLLSPRLERLVEERDDMALRIINISNWESPAAKQATNDFELPGLPYVRIYNPEGRFLGEVVGNHIEKITTILDGEKE